MTKTEPSKRRRKRLPLARWLRNGRVLVVISLTLITLALGHTQWFRGLEIVRRWEGQAHDTRFAQRGPLPRHPDVVVVGINTSSFDQKGLEAYASESEAIRLMYENPGWPWPRTIHARVVERLLEAGAKVVAIDLVFAANKAEDDELAAVFQKYPGRVVLGSTVQTAGAAGGEVVFQRVNSKLASAGGEIAEGFVTYPGDVDGVYRRFDYRTSEVREHPSLAGFDDPRDLWKFAPLAVHKFNGSSLPTDYRQPLNFNGPAETYRALPVENLFIEKIWKNDPAYRGGEAFRDKLVFYGPIAEILHDTMNTPFMTMPGVEVHAQLAASLLRGDLLGDAKPALEWVIAVVTVVAVALSVLLIPHALWQAVAILGIGGAFWSGTQLAFVKGGMIVPVVPTLFAASVTGAVSLVFLFFLEQWEKAQTRKVLNRSVNPRIAKVLLKNAESFDQSRRGKRQPVAIVFSDIRSFTTWSENADPEHLVGQLNEYFERMVALIEAEDCLGNAQKFIGDAILAAWGDTPENQFGPAEDARRATATALKMRAALLELNNGWAGRPDRIVISIGIGINSGDVVVGEVGHPDRGEYTVLGDGVNFAARLESATKQFHTDCLVGEQVEKLTRDHFIFRHVDYLKVKGKTKPVNVYTLISDRTVPPPDWLADYHRARALYVDRKFPESASLFREVKASIGGEDYLCDMYAERCDLYAMVPPAADWDGSYTMTEK